MNFCTWDRATVTSLKALIALVVLDGNPPRSLCLTSSWSPSSLKWQQQAFLESSRRDVAVAPPHPQKHHRLPSQSYKTNLWWKAWMWGQKLIANLKSLETRCIPVASKGCTPDTVQSADTLPTDQKSGLPQPSLPVPAPPGRAECTERPACSYQRTVPEAIILGV